jgi:hypothetical protein
MGAHAQAMTCRTDAKSELKVARTKLPNTDRTLGIGHEGVSTEHTDEEDSHFFNTFWTHEKVVALQVVR